MDKQTEEFINKLQLVRDRFVRDEQELKVSIRRDIVAIELKDIISKNNDYSGLKESIENYIKELYNLDKENKENGTDE